jgi:hypothetical protein
VPEPTALDSEPDELEPGELVAADSDRTEPEDAVSDGGPNADEGSETEEAEPTSRETGPEPTDPESTVWHAEPD